MVKVYDLESYKKLYNKKIVRFLHTPFQTLEWISFHEKSFGDRFVFLSVEDGGEFLMGAGLFRTETPYGNMYYSYGRFGTSGIVIGSGPVNSDEELRRYLSEIIKAFREKVDPDAVSLSIGSVQTGGLRGAEVRVFKELCSESPSKYFSRINHIADMNKLSDESRGLSLRKFNRNVKRNLRKAKECGIATDDKIDPDILKKWQGIHLERVSELGGKHWELSFFMSLYDSNAFGSICKFFGLYSDNQLVGGAVCVYNKYIFEIFMMSTLRKFQELGGNHILTEKIYNWSIEQEIPFVNWQGSNPPEGGVANFKRQWLAEDSVMHSMNFVFDQDKFNTIDFNLLLDEYPDRFFYPV